MTFRDNILDLFESCTELTIKEIVHRLGISKQMAHLVINRLCDENKVEKLGTPPKTVYRLIPSSDFIEWPGDDYFLPNAADELFLEKNFLYVTESGQLLEGFDGFDYWCNGRQLPVKKTLAEFIAAKKKYAIYYDSKGMVNGLTKLKNTKGYEEIWLDQLYYLDFYATERFGRTRLGTLLYYAKQGQSKFLMDKMMDEITGRMKDFLKSERASAVGFIPPTIDRKLQLMKYMQMRLDLLLPVIDIKKVIGLIPVPQKSLYRLDERIRNADMTFATSERRLFNHIVLIDDAVGSGATLNQVAAKLKKRGIAKKITALAIVGSLKGFDVITEI